MNEEYPYLEPRPMGGTDGEPDSEVVGKWRRDNEVCLRCGASRTVLKEMIALGDRGNLTIVEAVTSNCPACKKALEMMK